jgi:multiple sugar transport system substrate-binding protein
MTPHRHFSNRATRRNVLKGSLATGAGIALAGSGRRGFNAVGAQTPGAFDRETSIVSWGFGVNNPLATARAEAFQEAYPTIEIEFVPELDDQKILTAAASETLPDLLWIDRASIASWAERGVVTSLDECIQQTGINPDDYYEAAINESTYDGQIYGIPGGMDVSALYVNLDALNEIGVDGTALDTSDWEMLSDLGEQLVKRDGDQITRWGFDTKLQGGFLWLWGLGNGGSFFTEDGTEATYDDEQVVDALQWGVNVYERQGGFQDYEAVATTWQGDEQFARGQVAMTMYQSWMLGIIARVAPDLNFAVLPIRERGSGPDGPMVSFTGGRAWSIPTGASDPEAACEFIAFMHTLDTWMIGARARKEAAIAEGGYYIPALTAHRQADLQQIEELYEPISPNVDAAVRLFPELLEASVIRPVSSSPAGARLGDVLHEIGTMPALRGERPPAESLAEADQEAQEAIEEFT